MSWLLENWIWVLFGLAFVAMHMFGHGGHGGHGGRSETKDPAAEPPKTPGAAAPGAKPEAHRHYEPAC